MGRRPVSVGRVADSIGAQMRLTLPTSVAEVVADLSASEQECVRGMLKEVFKKHLQPYVEKENNDGGISTQTT